MIAQKKSSIRRNSGRRSRRTRTKGQTTSSRPVSGSSKTKSTKQKQQKRQSSQQNGRHFKRIPPPPKDTLRIIPIGGCEEVGRNMSIFEYNNDIIIHDMGLQFPEEDMPGIDYIVPNISYLRGKEKNIRGVVLSHGHLDHIGAAPILLERLDFPTVVAMPLTLAMLKDRQEDYKKGTAKNLKTITIKDVKDKIKLGKFTLNFFPVEHSIMDSVGVVIETPAGNVMHPGDWTMERDEKGKTHVKYTQLKKVKSPSVLMLESLGSLKEGRHATPKEMYKNLYDILKGAPGRVIIATFSSQVQRVKWLIQAARDLGRKVALDGYSMKKNIEIAKKLGYMKPAKGILIDVNKTDNYPDNKVAIVCTGAQGEENAVLNRIASKQHRSVKLRKSDTVIFSSSIIPGNERTIQKLKDNIYRQSDYVIHGDLMDVHVSGHSTRQDIVDMLKQVQPDYYMPVYANHFFLKEAERLAVENGFKEKNIFIPDNGTIFELNKKTGLKRTNHKAPAHYVFVDGLGVSDSQNVVLRDRQVLAEDGMVVVIVTVRSRSGQLAQNPDIISRGFVFLKDNKSLIEEIRHKVKKMVISSDPKSWADTNQIRNDIRDKVGQFIYTKTEKRPMVLPVVIEV